jgi:hypothetical protein
VRNRVVLLVLLLAMQVREVRGRLLSYWRRQVLVEAAAEAFPPSSSSRGPPHIRATLDNQVRALLGQPSGSLVMAAGAVRVAVVTSQEAV